MAKKGLSHHDRYVRSLMEDPRVAEELFEANLPAAIREQVDLKTLKMKKDSFIDDKLRTQIADLLFEVQVNDRTGYFHLLLEHQTKSQKHLPFRLLKYMVAIKDRHIKEGHDDLPFVYPMVLYTGKKPYAHSMDYFDLYGENRDLARQVFQNPFHLIDLTQVPEDQLKPYHWFGTMALIAKHIRDQDFFSIFESLMPALKIIEKTDGIDYIVTSISYIFEAGEIPSQQDFIQLISRELEEIEEDRVMTLAEQCRQEGMQLGRQEGMQQGIQKGMLQGRQEGAKSIALSMIQEGVPLETIMRCTGLSEKDISMLRH